MIVELINTYFGVQQDDFFTNWTWELGFLMLDKRKQRINYLNSLQPDNNSLAQSQNYNPANKRITVDSLDSFAGLMSSGKVI